MIAPLAFCANSTLLRIGTWCCRQTANGEKHRKRRVPKRRKRISSGCPNKAAIIAKEPLGGIEGEWYTPPQSNLSTINRDLSAAPRSRAKQTRSKSSRGTITPTQYEQRHNNATHEADRSSISSISPKSLM